MGAAALTFTNILEVLWESWQVSVVGTTLLLSAFRYAIPRQSFSLEGYSPPTCLLLAVLENVSDTHSIVVLCIKQTDISNTQP